MTRTEALEFLELPGNATAIQMAERIKEKLERCEWLAEHAPSAFLRQLNGRHLTQVLQIQKATHLLEPPLPEPAPVDEQDIQQPEPEVGEPEVPEEESPEIPVPPEAPADPAPDTPLPPTEEQPTFLEKPAPEEPLAFLIRHTENQSAKPFPLYAGKNYVGRKMHPILKPFIVLEEDEYVSRVHAVIEMQADPFESYIEDSASSNGGKPSMNGTYLNGAQQRMLSRTKLQENDTIQIGETKLRFRINTTHLQKIVEEVENSDFMHTVVVRV